MSMPKKGGSAWQYTERIYGGIGDQHPQEGTGNLIATKTGGGRNSKKRKGCYGGSRKSKRVSHRRVSYRKSGGKKRKMRGGCGCGGTPSPTPEILTSVDQQGGSAVPAPSESSLLSGPV